MPTYTDPFGGGVVEPAQVSYRAVALTADIALAWTPYATAVSQVAARIMDVTPDMAGWDITMPDARQVSPGTSVFFNNVGAFSFTVLDNDGGVLGVCAAGIMKLLYLRDNSTNQGTWRISNFGTGTTAADASDLQGMGLQVIGTTLAAAAETVTVSGDYDIDVDLDLAKAFIWTGGVGTLTLPDLVDARPYFFVEIRNQGDGVLTVEGDVDIEGSVAIELQVNESCFFHAGPTEWYTVGRGRNAQFSFTRLSKAVNGGTDTLTLTEASNVVQEYTGVLLSAQIVVVPAVVQVYYISNATTGGFSFTVESPVVGGDSVAIPEGANGILFCDGTNVINCTTATGTFNPILAVGSVGSPSLSFSGDAATGLYQPTSSTIGFTVAGVERGRFTTAGLTVTGGVQATAVGNVTPGTGAFTTLSGSVSVTTASVVATAATIGTAGITSAAIGTLTLTNPLTVPYGGTGRATSTTAYALLAAGTTATGVQQSLAAGATTELLVGGGAAALPVWTTATGSGAPVRATSPTLVTPALGTPASGTLTSCTGLPISTGVSGLGSGVATLLATFSSANLLAALTTSTGTGSNVFGTGPTLSAPILGTPASGNLVNCTGYAGGAALSAISAATGSATISSGDNPITWRWRSTTASQNAFTITESTASTSTGNPALLQIATLNNSTISGLRVQHNSQTLLAVGGPAAEETYMKGYPGTGATAGSTLNVTGGLGGSTGAGGQALVYGGDSGTSTGAGGAARLEGGDAVGGSTAIGGVAYVTGGYSRGSNAGAAVEITGGTGLGTGLGGAVNITGGTTVANVGGAVNITAGASVGTAGAGINITATAGDTGTQAGGSVNLVPGAAASTGIPGEVKVAGVAGMFGTGWYQNLAASVPVSGQSNTFFIAERACRLQAASIICSSSGTQPTVTIKKETGTTAPGSGTTVTTAAITFSATANTRVAGTLSATVATITMAAGDRLSVTWGGTVGTMIGAAVSVLINPC